jgi:copper chaperone CopZ
VSWDVKGDSFMKGLKTLALLGTALTTAAIGAVAFTGTADDSRSGLATTIFTVEGMTCGGCEAGIKVAVKKLDGIEKVTASHTEGRATVTYDPLKVTPEDIEAAIEKIGYEAEVLEDEAGA